MGMGTLLYECSFTGYSNQIKFWSYSAKSSFYQNLGRINRIFQVSGVNKSFGKNSLHLKFVYLVILIYKN